MIRKMLVIAAAVAIPVSMVAATGGVSGASSTVTPINASGRHVSCTGGAATAGFSPALHLVASTTSSPEVTKIKGTLAGCTVTGTPTITITSAAIKGTITNALSNHGCVGLVGPTTETGNLTVTWKTVQKLVSKTSVLTAASVLGAAGGDGHGTFSISFSAATGSFSGNVGTDSTDNETVPTSAALLGTCNTKSGLKSLAVQPDANTGNPSISIG
jgi:hypothetical protein